MTESERLKAARESYEMCVRGDSPLSEISRGVVRGFFVGVWAPARPPVAERRENIKASLDEIEARRRFLDGLE